MSAQHLVEQTDQFRALGDDGVLYTVVEFTTTFPLSSSERFREPPRAQMLKDYVIWPRCIPVDVDADEGLLKIAANGVLLTRL
ncbi:MAG: hypothetical protein K2Y51_02700 [Gammaproteobacteria bacterium]|jgi:hypothetical protein|nr:hypothetical protein [Gammaproteobacteria bacterium]